MANLLGYGTAGLLADTAADSPSTLHISGSVIHIDLVSKPPALSQEQMLFWIRTAGRAVSTYYGRFPVKEVTLHIQVNAEGHEIHGRTFDGERIEVGFGPDVIAADLTDDWILTHEMFHLASPDLGDEHLWLAKDYRLIWSRSPVPRSAP